MKTVDRIVLIDGDLRRRAGVSHLLAGGGTHVEPYEDLSEIQGRWPPDALVLIHDKGSAVPEMMEDLVRSGNWLPVVAFAEAPEARRIVDAILAGAIDYIPWPFGEAELTAMLETAEGRANGVGSARLREAVARSRIERLTPREREVLNGVANGHSNRLIAEQLAISPRTVEIHRANMLQKIGAQHTSEAIRIAIEAALVD